MGDAVVGVADGDAERKGEEGGRLLRKGREIKGGREGGNCIEVKINNHFEHSFGKKTNTKKGGISKKRKTENGTVIVQTHLSELQ